MINLLIGFMIGLIFGIYHQQIADWINHQWIYIKRWNQIPFSNDVGFAWNSISFNVLTDFRGDLRH
jgi:hypothetical protein